MKWIPTSRDSEEGYMEWEAKDYYLEENEPKFKGIDEVGIRQAWNKGKTYEELFGVAGAKEWKNKLSETRKRLFKEGKLKHPNENIKNRNAWKDAIRQAHLGKKRTKEHRIKISNASRKNWANEEFAKKQLKAMRKNMRPNKTEKIMDNILQKYFPTEWKYVGDGQVWLGKKNPDFINCNGKKQIIEVFGDYWHGKRKNIPYLKRKKGTIAHYKKYGFNTLVVWENELINKDKNSKIIEKIRRLK